MKTFVGPKVRELDDILNDTQMVKELRRRITELETERTDMLRACIVADARFRVHVNDLTAKLAAANAELYDLRITELEAEIGRLKQIAAEEVDEFNAGHTAYRNGLSIRDEPSGTKHDCWRIGYAFAAFDDLTAKLAAANAELHELRIKTTT